ncbi:potassium-transporting ATPase subunit KdpC [Geobacter sulfurreducens]|uniref:potassium-transporting ATPase subunit KdpC n=1 Tax=Geobacter sulfurreducens TaxID=35554 RepID=UPI000DBB4335|nr:potassium-transporting ATPase subunit KdpC [Geobacter sulfurreducens]BBA70913.1 Potassium-transporting ATPase KdpC subunit [Geobacter sulfurreducens]
MKDLKPAILMLIIFTILCGGIYPAVVTGIARAVFPKQAKGSLITDARGREVGSTLIGQPFSGPKYFWPRPSATPEFGYNPAGSGGSNAGPANPAYLKTVGERVKALRDAGIKGSIPADLVQASASGLDPHISPEAAKVQIPRVARARGMSAGALSRLVAAHTEDRQLGFLGEPRINVLALNLALDTLMP